MRDCSGKNNGFYGKHHTEEWKRRNREMMKGKLIGDKNPAKRPEVRKKIQLSILAWHKQNPEFAMKGDNSPSKRPEVRRKIGEATSKRMKDTEYKKRHTEAVKIGMNKPETKQKLKRAWTIPEVIEKHKRARAKQVLPVKDSKPEIVMQKLLTELIRKEQINEVFYTDRKSTRLNSSHVKRSRMPSSA